ncbi:hypothetical protein [Thioclava sp. GXIMD4216]|uniref:Uncharacterized protein n=1 Tax=Thioclava litoralis TaxID=3076557 RepID=A0ABZ1E2T7_9RHOB|nr:hypothetical protein RPE78_05125 [Thioclava sp. FTW29]
MEFLPKDIAQAMREAQTKTAGQRTRLSLKSGEKSWPILRRWRGGLALNADEIDHLRGEVALYEGIRHIATGLIIASEVENGELICTIKRETPVMDRAPLDFVRDPNAPAGYLPSA